MKKVFIDGSAGTTGLRIRERLSTRDDIKLINLPEKDKKDPAFRKQAITESDITFLCLPDAAAIQSAELAKGTSTVIIDTSTAHRTEKGWAYGFPELSSDFKKNVESFDKIAVPGCHASGFISSVFPLVEAGIISKDECLTCFSMTGYSGGGKKMIAEYQDETRSQLLDAPRQYALTQQHKHLKEMKAVCELSNHPIFCPVVSDFYSGMVVTVLVFKSVLQKGADINTVKEVLKAKYQGPVVNYKEEMDEDGFISAATLSGKDSMEITVQGNEDRILLISRYDNLGKGASGAAIQCLNIALGNKETKGLIL